MFLNLFVQKNTSLIQEGGGGVSKIAKKYYFTNLLILS